MPLNIFQTSAVYIPLNVSMLIERHVCVMTPCHVKGHIVWCDINY